MPGWIGRLEERQQLLKLEALQATAAGEAALGAAETEQLVLQCRELSCKGRLCRAQLSLGPRGSLSAAAGSAPATASGGGAPQQPQQQHGGFPNSSSSSGPTEGLAGQWQHALTDALLSSLRHAELEPADVAGIKIYCPGEAAVQAGQQLRGLLAGALGKEVQATVVPVLAVGGDVVLASRLLIELLAVRLPPEITMQYT